MSPKVWRLSGVAAAVLALVATWFLAIAPQRRAAEELRVQAVAQEAASADLRSKIELLKKQSAEIPAKEAELSTISRQLPAGVGIPNLVRTITGVGKQTDVSIASIEPGNPVAVAVESAPTAPAPASSGDATANDATAAAPRAVSSGLMSVPLTIGVCGSYSQLRNFLAKVETLPRAVLVTSIDIKRGCGNNAKQLGATISTNVFALPAKADAQSSSAQSNSGTASAGQVASGSGAAKGENPS